MIVDRLYRFLLRAYPQSFRQTYATSIAETFASRKADTFATHGWAGRLWFLVRETLGLLGAALRQRIGTRCGRDARAPGAT